MAGKRATKIDAVLRHLAAGEDISSFPGTRYENLAVVRTAVHRGLISWDAEGNRYTLTPAGWGALTPRRFGMPSLVASTAIGAAVGAAALAFLWVPGVKWQGSAQATASPVVERPVVEKPIVATVPAPADVGGRSVAPMTSTAVPVAKPASAPVPAATPAAPTEPPVLAADPAAPEPPAVETPPVKQAAVKKPRRKTVRRHEQTNPFANPWGGRQASYPRYGQGSWYAYR
jgi:hypothetical protein